MEKYIKMAVFRRYLAHFGRIFGRFCSGIGAEWGDFDLASSR
jgi:hypothetical protein